MATRRPGPTCATTADCIDDGKLCLQKSPLPGPAGIKLADSRRARVSFGTLWAGYPDDKPYVDVRTGNPPKGFENQCAIKVSGALHAADVDLRSFRGAHVSVKGRRAAIRAEELAPWLKRERVAGITLPAEIDLWNGSRLKASGLEGMCTGKCGRLQEGGARRPVGAVGARRCGGADCLADTGSAGNLISPGA